MSRRQRQWMALALAASDLAVTALVWFAAYALRFACWPAPAGVPGPELVAVALPQVLLLAVLAYRFCGMYQVHRLRRFWAEASTVAMASGLLFLLTTTITFYFRELYESRLALGLFLLLNALALAASRRAVWWFFTALRQRGYCQGRAVLVGSGRMARLALETLTTNRWAGTQIVGYVDHPGQRGVGPLPRLGDI